jgi:hypothetical protein
VSKPIFEPSLTREDARLSFGNDQLFRRPSPSGQGILPSFRARRELGSLSVSDLANTNVCWDNWEICDTSVFEEGDLGSGGCANQLIEVNLLATGVYAIHAQLDYEEDLTFDTGIGIYDNVNSKMWHSLGNWLDVNTAGPSLTIEIVRAYHADDSAQIRVETLQNSGSPKNIGSDDTGCSNFFQIYYLGAYDCEDCPASAILPYIGGGFSCGPSS